MVAPELSAACWLLWKVCGLMGAIATDSAPSRNGAHAQDGVSTAEVQRARLILAMIEVVGEHGARAVTIERVVVRAGVSRRTFYEIFEDADDCMLAAFEHGRKVALGRAAAAYRAELRWVDRVRAGLLVLLEFFDSEPGLARLCIVEPCPVLSARRAELVAELAQLIDEGRSGARRQPAPLTAEGLVGGVLCLMQTRLTAAGEGTLAELLNPLMSFLALPYLGVAGARLELSRRRVKQGMPDVHESPDAGENENRGADQPRMRMTYRTMRVLAAIAVEAGLSNIQVAERAGIADEGQASKLLRRLAQYGLIENTGEGQSRGASNAWQLTERGQRLNQATTRADVGAAA